MEEDGDPTTPFWLQSNNNLYHHRRRRSSPFLLNPALLIVLLPTIALLVLFLVVPSLVSFVSQNFRPNSVKKNWDSLNLLLVLFAIACGFLNKRNDDSSSSSPSTSDEAIGVSAQAVSENPVQSTTPRRQWFEYSSDPRIYDSAGTTTTSDSTDPISRNAVRLRRNCSSYPDLRQEFSWVSGDENRWRFFDDNDIDLNTYRTASENVRRRRRRQPEIEHSKIKPIPFDNFVPRPMETPTPASPPPPSEEKPPAQPPQPPQPPPTPPPPPAKKKTTQTFHSVERKEKAENPEEVGSEIKRSRPIRPPSPPPPPPPPEEKSERNFKKRGSGAKDIANTLASLYQHRKKKKKQKYRDNEDGTTQLSPPFGPPPPPSAPPPAPPPPPPASVFQNLFSSKKISKSKRIYSLTHSQLDPSPPPPPPPPPRQRKTSSATGTMRPPLPAKIRNMLYEGEENLSSGGQSPLVPMPPPPPLPPFRMTELKFVVRGDFVRIRSSNNSPINSPTKKEPESGSGSVSNASMSTSATTTMKAAGMAMMDGGNGSGGAVFCPSPDVNTKADTFIARFRAGLKLEKMNSIKAKQTAQGPDPSPSPSPSASHM